MINRIHLKLAQNTSPDTDFHSQSRQSQGQAGFFWSILDCINQTKLGHIGLSDDYQLAIEIYPEFRMKGLATESICQLNQWLQRHDINLAQVQIESSNFAATQLFKNFAQLARQNSRLKYAWSPFEKVTDWHELYAKKIQNFNSQFEINKQVNPLVAPACQLIYVEQDMFDRPAFLHPSAQKAWQKLKKAAQSDQVELKIISAFRDLSYQANLIRNKLAKGLNLADILTVNALPGYSEHHSGCALDIGAEGEAILEDEFDQSQAFAWLQAHAADFDFYLSYPKANGSGIIYEPWHWCYLAKAVL